MPTLPGVLAGAAVSAGFFTLIGLPLARVTLPRGLAWGAAPALGWAAFSAIALPLFTLLPWHGWVIALAGLVAAAAAVAALRALPAGAPCPARMLAAAALLAVLPAVALMPKQALGGVLLGPPMFDHAKVAIIDQIARTGLPPENPFAATAAHAPLAYYYLWHADAALLDRALHLGGWTADVALSWFTAAASAALMMALASLFGAGRWGPALVAALSLPASLRTAAALLVGRQAIDRWLPPGSDIGGWVNQASWVPQHLASGSCVVLAGLLMAALVQPGRLGAAAAVLLGLVVASGVESSAWVGGVAFGVAALAAAPVLLWQTPGPARRSLLARCALAVAVAAMLAGPFAWSLAGSVAARGGAAVALVPYRALGGAGWGGAAVDLLAFWPLILPFNLPALAAGLFALRALVHRPPAALGLAASVLATMALACLCVTWLVRSTIENNDLGWRAAIPAILILTPAVAALARRHRPRLPALLCATLAALGLPGAAEKTAEALRGQRPADAAAFAAAPLLWQAVRQVAAPGDRIANNPLQDAAITPWPDNIGWALFSDRPSCFSGWATAVAYAGLPRPALEAASALFLRVFAGRPQPGDLEALRQRFACTVAVVTPQDGAWSHDPFGGASGFALAVSGAGWRVYRSK